MGEYETSAKSATASNRKDFMQARNQTGQQLAKHVVLFGKQENSEFFHDFVRTVP